MLSTFMKSHKNSYLDKIGQK